MGGSLPSSLAGPAERGADGRRALGEQLAQRLELGPPVRYARVVARPRAAVTAGLLQRARQAADRAQELRDGRLVQPRQDRVHLREQAGHRAEQPGQLRGRPGASAAGAIPGAYAGTISGAYAGALAEPAEGSLDRACEIHRDPDQGVVGVLAARPELKRVAHVAAVRVQPPRPQQPGDLVLDVELVVSLVVAEEVFPVVLAVRLVGGLVTACGHRILLSGRTYVPKIGRGSDKPGTLELSRRPCARPLAARREPGDPYWSPHTREDR